HRSRWHFLPVIHPVILNGRSFLIGTMGSPCLASRTNALHPNSSVGRMVAEFTAIHDSFVPDDRLGRGVHMMTDSLGTSAGNVHLLVFVSLQASLLQRLNFPDYTFPQTNDP